MALIIRIAVFAPAGSCFVLIIGILVVIVVLLLLAKFIAVLTSFLLGLALLLLIAYAAGAVAQSWLKYPGGFLSAFISGLLGGVVGLILAKLLHAPTLLTISGLPVLWTFVGAVIVVGANKVIGGGRGSRTRMLR